MQTNFSARQLDDPATASSEAVIRKCVHCGFCIATCPTYVLLGDERDSPRGRIYLMKEMLENERQPTAEVVKHIDRCLSCLACMTSCPSGVNYMHLVDHARTYVEERYRRPIAQRLFREILAALLPHPRRFRAALMLARLVRPATPMFRLFPGLKPLVSMLTLTPKRVSALPSAEPSPSHGNGRVLLLQGCAEPVLRPEIRAATVRLLNRSGYEVTFARGEGCCGALVHHLGKEAASLAAARRNIDAWDAEIRHGLDAIIITAAGCGTAIKNYGFMLRADAAYAAKAALVSSIAKDVSEILGSGGMPEGTRGVGLNVAYHSACSMQHGQRVDSVPRQLLTSVGFTVVVPNEAHLCCGSAGTYNLLQPDIADELGDRKVANIERLAPDVIATGNIGCALQIGQRTSTPVVHTVELLDWATGGPIPPGLSSFASTGLLS